jgi:hypothetical protein
MNDDDLRSASIGFQKKFGTSIIFVATKCDVSREHLSRWLHNDAYVISIELKTKIKMIIRGEM